MRHDMAKVVTERPRYKFGGYAPNRRSRLRFGIAQLSKLTPEQIEDWDLGPTHLPISHEAKYHESKGLDGYRYFTDLIGPLRRYLSGQVGRDWNDIYSELSAHLDRRSLTGAHIWTHVFQEVERYCFIDEKGVVYSNTTALFRRPRQPLLGLYVHPTTGKLEFVSR